MQRGDAALDLNMLDRPDRIMELEHAWSDPDGSANVYGARRFEGKFCGINQAVWLFANLVVSPLATWLLGGSSSMCTLLNLHFKPCRSSSSLQATQLPTR